MLAQQMRPTISKNIKMSKLMTGIGLRQGLSPGRQILPAK
jgi:hypothetical protein